MATQERPSDAIRAGGGAPDAPPGDEILQRALLGDSEALGFLFRRHKERLMRIVAIRFAVRIARIFDEDEATEEALRAALLATREADPTSEADLVRWMSKWVAREVRRRADVAPGETRDRPRTLRFVDPAEPVDARATQREGLERLVDSRVAELEPEELREVLLLRDYCGADWELVRERLGLPSIEAARELHRRAHERLARLMRSPPRKQA